jgi:hypothetical protein
LDAVETWRRIVETSMMLLWHSRRRL